MTREDLVALLSGHDPLAAAARVAPSEVVTWTRDGAPDGWLVDEGDERPVDEHRAAHREGRPSEAVVRYGAGVDPGRVADRLLALAELSRETGMLRAVCPVPSEGDATRPGSWGVEDLTVIAAARIACPDVPWVRPDWRRLGAGACQVATAFGATDWRIPEADPADPDLLAAGVGRTAVER